MAWIEVHQALLTHRKTGRLMRALDISRPTAVGHLVALWCWSLDNAPEGDLAGMEAADLAESAYWDEDPAVFVGGLIQAGWIDDTPTGWALHDWYDFAGRLIDQRRANAERFTYLQEQHTDLRAAVIARDGLVCGLCSGAVSPEDVQLDHIIPRSKGGPTTLENLRVTHSLCNNRRGNREDWTPEEALR